MSDILQSLLAERDCLVADGAMGTNLFEAGLMTGDSPELWNLAHPEKIAAVHRGMVDAGADIILTNTFGGNRYRLALHGAEARVAGLNRAGAAIARGVADAAGRKVVVAGSLGPTGEIYQPVGPLGIADGSAAFAEQARALAEGGADVLWIETISGVEELEAAVGGAAGTGLPIIATMTFDTNGRTMMGLAPGDAVRFARGLGIGVERSADGESTRPGSGLAAFGSNCGIGPAALIDSLLGIGAAAEAGDVRRLLRHLAGPPRGDRRGAEGLSARPGPGPRRHRGEAGQAQRRGRRARARRCGRLAASRASSSGVART
jgi:5-methyltetrahydrofolate--homocysteine methyltransferase